MKGKIKSLLIAVAFFTLLIIVSTIIYCTLIDASIYRSFRASIPIKSNLKRASEIDYQDYDSREEIVQVDGIYKFEYILNSWYEGFEPVTVFYEDIPKPEADESGYFYDNMTKVVNDYVKDLLGEGAKQIELNQMDEVTGTYVYRKGNRDYRISFVVTDKTAEGMLTVFHSEVIPDEAK